MKVRKRVVDGEKSKERRGEERKEINTFNINVNG